MTISDRDVDLPTHGNLPEHQTWGSTFDLAADAELLTVGTKLLLRNVEALGIARLHTMACVGSSSTSYVFLIQR